MGTQIRFGLYGCNMYRTKELVEGAQAAHPDRLKIVACFDITREKADFAAAQYGGVPYYDEASFLRHEMDVVLISLPPYLHPEAFAHTVAAGKDVYLEKPVCVDAKGRAILLEAQRKHKVKCYVGLSYRHIQPFLKIAELLRRPDAGRILSVNGHWMSPGGAVPPPDPSQRNWRHRMEQGGGQLVNHCCHFLDWCRWIGGEFSAVSAVDFTPGNPPEPHEEMELQSCFTYRKSGIATFHLSQHSHQGLLSGTVLTENMGIRWQWSSHSFVKVFKTRPHAADEIVEWAGTDGDADNTAASRNTRQMREFMDAWLAGAEMPISLQDGIAAYDMAMAVRESCRAGRTVALPESAAI